MSDAGERIRCAFCTWSEPWTTDAESLRALQDHLNAKHAERIRLAVNANLSRN